MIVMCAASPNFVIAGQDASLLEASVAPFFPPVAFRLQWVANLFAKLKSSCENANSSEQIAFMAGHPGFFARRLFTELFFTAAEWAG
jgi:hypothetical protein